MAPSAPVRGCTVHLIGAGATRPFPVREHVPPRREGSAGDLGPGFAAISRSHTFKLCCGAGQGLLLLKADAARWGRPEL